MKYIIATVRILFLALFLLVAKGKMMLWLAIRSKSHSCGNIWKGVLRLRLSDEHCNGTCRMDIKKVTLEYRQVPKVACKRKIWMVCIGCKHGSNVVC